MWGDNHHNYTKHFMLIQSASTCVNQLITIYTWPFESCLQTKQLVWLVKSSSDIFWGSLQPMNLLSKHSTTNQCFVCKLKSNVEFLHEHNLGNFWGNKDACIFAPQPLFIFYLLYLIFIHIIMNIETLLQAAEYLERRERGECHTEGKQRQQYSWPEWRERESTSSTNCYNKGFS